MLSDLRRRNMVRGASNPTGDYGELLFSRVLGWTHNNNPLADADAVDADSIEEA